MKRTYPALLLTLLLSMVGAKVSAYDVCIDDIYYDLSGKIATVTDNGTSVWGSSYSGDVVIPPSITSNGKTYDVTGIDDYAFSLCNELTSVSIPSSVTWIGSWAFKSCEGLTTVTFSGKGLTIIGEYAFVGCSNLSSINIPSSVTSIDNCAFSGCSGLTSVTIPSSVTTIGDSAFSGCSGLTSVTIPGSVTSIGSSAFSSCSDLTSVTISEGVTSIGEDAFRGCSGLTSVAIPASVTSISATAFSYCDLASISVAQGNSVYDSRNHCNAIIQTSTHELLFGCKNTTIPNDVTSIGAKAFFGCTGLTSITIPNGITSIGDAAFSGCSGLTSVNITDLTAWCNIQFGTNDSSNPLYYAHHLLLNGEEVKDLVIPDGVTEIHNIAFCNCDGLTSVTIPGSVSIIGKRAFWSCDGLTKVIIHEGVTSIGGAAFSRSGVNFVVIPSTVTSLGGYTFENCNNLWDVYCFATTLPSAGASDFYYSSVGSATLHVPAAALENYQNTVPWSSFGTITDMSAQVDGITYELNPFTQTATVVASTEEEPYSGDIVIPSSFEYSGVTYAVTAIGDYAFSACWDLTSVVIPEGVTTIGEGAFNYCVLMSDLTIPASVTTIGDVAFYYCASLTSVTIPANVTSIGNGAFTGCGSLATVKVEGGNQYYDSRDNCNAIIETETKTLIVGSTNVTIPNTVTAIGNGAFCGYSGLTSVTIPASVTSIGDGAFAECDQLRIVYCEGTTVPEATFEAFYYTNYNSFTLYVPASAIDSYKADELWGEFGEILPMPVVVGGIAYVLNTEDRTAMVSATDPGYGGNVDIPASITVGGVKYSVTAISDQAFMYCWQLTSVTIPEGVINIGKNAFLSCTALTSVTLPASVTSLGDGSFSGCWELSTVTVLFDAPLEVSIYTFDYSFATLYVPYGCAAAFREAAFWSEFQNIVELPADPTIPASGFATYCSIRPLDFSSVKNVQAYVASGFDPSTNTVLLTSVTEVPAGEGVLIAGKVGTYKVPECRTNMTYSNLLVGFTEPETITPQYDHDFYYVLRDGNQGIGFYRTGTSTEVAAYTACLRLPEAQEYAGVNFIRFTLADGTVGVEEVKSERVRSEESAGAVYDLNGQHHSSLQRGVNIVRSANGKTRKVVVR